MKALVIGTMICLIISASAHDAVGGEKLIYAVLFPGLGHIKTGHYGRGAIFAGAELVSLLSLAVTQIQYNRTVEQYDQAKSFYLTADYIGDAQHYYDRMNTKWDDAENLHRYRNILLGTAIGIWAVNIIDMAFIKDGDGPPVSLHVGRDGFLIAKTFTF